MNAIQSIITERVDDIPLLLTQMKKIDLSRLLDEHFPQHGNSSGISFGDTITIWLSHILSEADHRLSHVQSWADQRLQSLSILIGQEIKALNFSDDRLARLLMALSDDERWNELEIDLNQMTLRVYDLKAGRVRLDSTTASNYGSVDANGIFQFGHSKDHRPDLPQLKIMMSTLDPLGMPLCACVISGEKADDPLYIPAVDQVRKSIQNPGLLYIGDCKMASVMTRYHIQKGNDFYLCPLSAVQVPTEALEKLLLPLWNKEITLANVERMNDKDELEVIAQGFEFNASVTHTIEDTAITWEERRLVVYSPNHAKRSEAALKLRITKATEEISNLNLRGKGRKRFTDEDAFLKVGLNIAKRHRVADFLTLTINRTLSEKHIRAHKDKHSRVEITKDLKISVQQNEIALFNHIRNLGWRVFATNHPPTELSLQECVFAYRSEYLIERGFGRLKGKPLSIMPMYLDIDEHVTGLVRLLILGLRVLVLLEYEVRKRLSEESDVLKGLYAGNPQRKTQNPSAELLLRAFKHINLNIVNIAGNKHYHITVLNELQERILTLLGLTILIYTQLASQINNPLKN